MIQNYIFVAISIILFLIIPLAYLLPDLKFLFNPIFERTTYYGFISGGFIFIEFLVWRTFQIKGLIVKSKRKGIRRLLEGYWKLFKDVSIFIGLKKVSYSESFVGILIGLLCGMTAVFSMSYFENLSIEVITFGTFLKMLVSMPIEMAGIYLIPIFEELVFRGFFLSRFLHIFKNKRIVVIGLIISSFIFGYSHLEYPIYKVFVGFVLGIIYLWRWKKNISISTVTHITGNAFLVFIHAA